MPTASLLEELVAFDKAGVKVFTGLWCLAHSMSMSVAATAAAAAATGKQV